MKTTIDTNIFVYATISRCCAKAVSNTYEDNSFNIILRTVTEEAKPKLMELFNMIQILREETYNTKSALKQIDSRLYEQFKQKYPQIHKSIRNYIAKNIKSKKDHPQLRDVLGSILNDIRRLIQIMSDPRITFPFDETDFRAIRSNEQFKNCIESLKEIIKNEKDRLHLGLCEHYITCNLKSKEDMTFLTIDKEDFISHGNKERIEKTIQHLIINTLPKLDIENIIL